MSTADQPPTQRPSSSRKVKFSSCGGERRKELSWQFPSGKADPGESPEVSSTARPKLPTRKWLR